MDAETYDPVAGWQVGYSPSQEAAVVVLTAADGHIHRFMLPLKTGQAMGEALAALRSAKVTMGLRN